MKHELEKQLATEFPFMYSRRSYTRRNFLREHFVREAVTNPYEAWGCECSGGWYELLRSLCAEIMEVYRKHDQQIDIIVDQVKEKWGTLRFYYHFDGHPQALHAFDFIGGGSIRFGQSATELQREIAAVVRKWEEKSAEVCEYCGAPGSLRKDRRVSTLCDNCWEKRKEYETKKTKGHKKEELR